MITKQESGSFIYDEDGDLIAVIHKDEKIRKVLFYACKEMNMTELERLLGSDTIK